MRYQQIKDKIHSLRMLSGQNELKTDILMLDNTTVPFKLINTE